MLPLIARQHDGKLKRCTFLTQVVIRSLAVWLLKLGLQPPAEFTSNGTLWLNDAYKIDFVNECGGYRMHTFWSMEIRTGLSKTKHIVRFVTKLNFLQLRHPRVPYSARSISKDPQSCTSILWFRKQVE